MTYTFGYTIFNKANLIPRIIGGIKDILDENDEAVFLFDACSDNSLEVFEKEKEALKCSVTKIISLEELFETKANNKILRTASRDIVVLFQDDMILQDSKFKEKISRIVEKYGDSLGLLGGRTGYETDGQPDNPRKQLKRVSNWEHLERQYGYRLKEGEFLERTLLNRGPLVFTKSLLKQVGLLDEIFEPQWQDEVDYCCRAQFKHDRKNVVFQCGILSPLKWGTMRSGSKLRKIMDKLERGHSEIVHKRWGKDLRKYYREEVNKDAKRLG